jgi:hypothetical protein
MEMNRRSLVSRLVAITVSPIAPLIDVIPEIDVAGGEIWPRIPGCVFRSYGRVWRTVERIDGIGWELISVH